MEKSKREELRKACERELEKMQNLLEIYPVDNTHPYWDIIKQSQKLLSDKAYEMGIKFDTRIMKIVPLDPHYTCPIEKWEKFFQLLKGFYVLVYESDPKWYIPTA